MPPMLRAAASIQNDEQQSTVLADAAAALEAVTARERSLDSAKGLDAAVQRDGGALAALRRVSRESIGTSVLIDRVARRLGSALERLVPITVVVPDVWSIDRLSLKILARACLLAPADSRVAWHWTESSADGPDGYAEDGTAGLLTSCRSTFLAGLQAAVAVEPQANVGLADPVALPRADSSFVTAETVGGACAWLSSQNYDACLRWAVSTAERDVDYHRLFALTSANLGLHDQAIAVLKEAVDLTPHATLKAHLLYMQGLLWSKRKYDITASDACFARAEAALDGWSRSDPGDPAMEMAWVHNGRAMNALLNARFAGVAIDNVFTTAFRELNHAFDLVKEGRTRDRVYLRYNLLGNMSSLMEIRGNYRLALELVTRTFEESLAIGQAEERAWLAMQRSKRAALMARAGEPAQAVPLFEDARAAMLEADRMVCAEVLTRSVATAQWLAGRTGEARETFADGLRQALDLRSRTGAQLHAAGLAACAQRDGATHKIRRTLLDLGESEGVWVADPPSIREADLSEVTPPKTLYGLSTSIPEVDLEEMAPVSIARALRGGADDIDRARRVGSR